MDCEILFQKSLSESNKGSSLHHGRSFKFKVKEISNSKGAWSKIIMAK